MSSLLAQKQLLSTDKWSFFEDFISCLASEEKFSTNRQNVANSILKEYIFHRDKKLCFSLPTMMIHASNYDHNSFNLFRYYSLLPYRDPDIGSFYSPTVNDYRSGWTIKIHMTLTMTKIVIKIAIYIRPVLL